MESYNCRTCVLNCQLGWGGGEIKLDALPQIRKLCRIQRCLVSQIPDIPMTLRNASRAAVETAH